ncbi:MAG: ABC transporter ATP-binding protein [Alphaproteobacteria bacterium]|nr:ABC transporter ATP-binding protein [Alphaproteobacteria bacterium]
MGAIEIEGVSKRYGGVRALDGLSLTVPGGGIYGLLGANGAGKSTLMRIVAGLVFADAGSVRLFGAPASPAGRRRLGALVESASFYPFLTAVETLLILADTSGVAIDAGGLLERVGLSEAADRPVGDFSLGMKQRLGIAAALIGAPDLLLLDEPANGLDPPGTAELRRLLRALAGEGMTILFSSHLLDEVERLCDRVAILDQGRLAAEGTLDTLLAAGERLWLDVAPVDRALARVGDRGTPDRGGIAVGVRRADVPALLKALADDGVAVYEARWVRPGLERYFGGEA